MERWKKWEGESNVQVNNRASIAAAAKLASFVIEMRRFDDPGSVDGSCTFTLTHYMRQTDTHRE